MYCIILLKKIILTFWKSIYKLEIPESLQNNLEKWKNKLPIYEDFVNDSSYSMFRSANFTLVLDGINFFNKEEILKEYNMITNQSKIYTSALIDSVNISEQNAKYVKHKDAISYIQNNFNSIIESA